MFARRQFEHGDFLSQRTLRLRHTTQLRSLAVALGGELARFSASENEATALIVSGADAVGGACAMLA